MRTISEYFEVHAGPEYQLHFRYAFVQVILLVCFTMGFGFPFMFPVCFLSLLFFYIFQKLTLAKFYRQPTIISESFNEDQILKTVASLHLFYVFINLIIIWYYGLFERTEQKYNDAGYLLISDNIKGHGGDGVILTYLIFFCVIVNFCRAHGFTGACGIKCCKKVSEKMNYPAVFDKIDQELDNNDQTFYESLRSQDRKWLIAEEKFL